MVKDEVIKTLKEVTGLSEITEDMVFGEDIIMTSLNIMKMLYNLEEALGIKDIPVELMYEIETVQELIDSLEKLRS